MIYRRRYRNPRRTRPFLGTRPTVAFDAASNSGYKTASGSYSWTHTCSGSNRLLLVGVSMLSVLGSSVSGITYNGVALTKVRSDTSGTGAIRTELWALTNPDPGANTIAVTLSTPLDSVSSASSWGGVDQVVSTEAGNGAGGSTGPATVNVTTVADGDLVVDVIASPDTTIAVGAGQTQRSNVSGTLGSGGMSSEGPKSPAGAVTMSWDVDALSAWAISSVALRLPGSPQVDALEQVAETDAARALAWAPKQRLVARTLEADSAFVIGSRKVVALGQVSESDSGQAVSSLKLRGLGKASETNTAQITGVRRTFALGQPLEPDSALVLSAARLQPLGRADEVDAALGAVARKLLGILPTEESDQSLALSITKKLNLGAAHELDQAQTLRRLKALGLDTTFEHDETLAAIVNRASALGTAQESDSARQLAIGKRLILHRALEADTAKNLASLKTLALGGALELDATMPMSAAHEWTISLLVVEELGRGKPIIPVIIVLRSDKPYRPRTRAWRS